MLYTFYDMNKNKKSFRSISSRSNSIVRGDGIRVVERNIVIPIELAQEVSGDKRKEEALAFAIQIKHTFTSSTLKGKYTTFKHLKTLFKIGHAKLKRIYNDAIELGYIVNNGNTIIAKNLKSDSELVYRIKVNNKKILLNKDAVSHIRKAIAIHHISKLTYYHDSLKRQTDPKTSKEYKAGKKEGKAMRGKKLFSKGVSIDRIAEVINCDRWRAKEVLNELIESKAISRKHQYISLGKRHAKASEWHTYANQGLFLRRINGNLVIQDVNLYLLIDNSLIGWYNYNS